MKRKIIAAIAGILISSGVIGGSVTYAWLARTKIVESNISAGAYVSYFECGDGTEKNPYCIRDPRHLYNLAWLQYLGAFEKPTFFKLSNNIPGGVLDMSDFNSSIPPIGTSEHPFYGYFDGNQKTISGLKISSSFSSWTTKPGTASADLIGSDVGFFGNICRQGDNEKSGVAENFYLKDISVTTNVSGDNSYIGLIAGNVNGSVSNIGVKGGSLLYNNNTGNSLVSHSNYTLLGYLDRSKVQWKDMPGNSGTGKLQIFPKEYSSLSENSEPYICHNAQIIDGKAMAKMYPSVTIGNFSPTSTVYMLNRKTTFGNDYLISKTRISETSLSDNKTTSTFTATSIDKNNVSSNKVLNADFIKAYGEAGFLSFSSTVIIENNTFNNCIWFKPTISDDCILAFGLTNYRDKVNPSMSVFRIKKDDDGNIISNEEMKITFDKASLKNGDIVYFSFDVDHTEGYEYVIGRRTGDTSTSSGFLFLSLGGSSDTGGEGGVKPKEVLRVDYIDDNPTNDIWSKDYTVHDVLLKTEANIPSGSTEASVSYNVDSQNNVVYSKNNSGITVTDILH